MATESEKFVIHAGVTGAQQVEGFFSRIGKQLKDLKRNDTMEGLEQVEKVLKGAGAAGAVAFATRTIQGMAEATRDWAQGSKTASEALLDAGKAVPIFGNLVSAMQAGAEAAKAIKENLDGTTESIKRSEAAWARSLELQKRGAAGRKAADALAGSVGDAGIEADRELARKNLPTIEKEFLTKRDALVKERIKIDAQRRSFIKTFGVNPEDLLSGNLREGAGGRRLFGREAEARDIAGGIQSQIEQNRRHREEADESLRRARDAVGNQRERSEAMGRDMMRRGGSALRDFFGTTVPGAIGGVFDTFGEQAGRTAKDREEADRAIAQAKIAAAEKENNKVLEARLRLLEDERRIAMDLVDAATNPNATASQRAQARQQIGTLDPETQSIAKPLLEMRDTMNAFVQYLKSLLGGEAVLDPISNKPIR